MIVLCSASPRRKEILQNLGLIFDTFVPDINEDEVLGEEPIEYLKRICELKVKTISQSHLSIPSPRNNQETIFISSDTIVVQDRKILHKPKDEREAFQILSDLVGREHKVHSGMCLLSGDRILWDYDSTTIQFKDWDENEIITYIENSKPFDKAGSYGIQDKDSPVQEFQGSYTNVMGFPIRKFFLYRDLWLSNDIQ